jgi:hypothetical protein
VRKVDLKAIEAIRRLQQNPHLGAFRVHAALAIERGRPWQSYIETTFNIQRRMADWHFARAESWPELVAIDDRWVQDYNEQSHFAHREREDGRRSPQEVLGWVTGVR